MSIQFSELQFLQNRRYCFDTDNLTLSSGKNRNFHSFYKNINIPDFLYISGRKQQADVHHNVINFRHFVYNKITFMFTWYIFCIYICVYRPRDR